MRFLEKLRKKQKLTQYAAAKKLDMLPQSYTHLEEKSAGCKLITLVKIKNAFALSWEQLGKLIEREVK